MNILFEAPGVYMWCEGRRRGWVKNMTHVFGGEVGVSCVTSSQKQDWLLALPFWAEALPSALANGGDWP